MHVCTHCTLLIRYKPIVRQLSCINITNWSTKKRNLTHKTFPQTHQNITLDIQSIMCRVYVTSSPPQPSKQHKFHAHHPIILVHGQSIADVLRHRHRHASDLRGQRHGAVLLYEERRKHDMRRNGLVAVGHVGGEPVKGNWDAPVRVSYDHVELHGDWHEWRRGGVEAVDGGAGHREARLGRVVGQPENEEYDAE